MNSSWEGYGNHSNSLDFKPRVGSFRSMSVSCNPYSAAVTRLHVNHRLEAQSWIIRNRYHNLHLANDISFPCYSRSGTGIETMSIDSSEERFLLVGCGEGSILLHDIEYPNKAIAQKRRRKRNLNQSFGHRGRISSLAWFAQDTGLFVTGCEDGTVLVWDTNEFHPISVFDLDSPVNSASLSPIAGCTVSNLIACGTNKKDIRLCDMLTGSNVQLLSGHTGKVFATAWSPLNEFQLYTGGEDKSIKIWDIRRSGKSACLSELDQHNSKRWRHGVDRVLAHDKAVQNLCFGRGGTLLLSCGSDRRIRVWNYEAGGNNGALFTNTLVNISLGLSKSCYSMALAEERSSSLHGLVFHPLSLQSHTSIGSFNLISGKQQQTLTNGHFQPVTALVYRRTSQELYTAGRDGLILKWSHESKQHTGIARAQDIQDDWSD